MTGSRNRKRPGGRALKQRVLEALKTGSETEALERLSDIPPRVLVSPLFGALHHMEPGVHWTAVRAMGAVAAELARQDLEEARVVLRRMMWNLNDESGGIGWGVPEAMAEILARHEGLAREFVNILASYTREDANYLEHEPLQKGLLWGIARLAGARPGLLKAAGPDLAAFMQARDPALRGLAAHAAGLLDMEEARPRLQRLLKDEAGIPDDLGGLLPSARIRELAAGALERIDRSGVVS
ncbi:MAG: HEAT repeat domain-containing protein [Deltaproteobacteria bacterium]|nr:HEAT repeat domain-containing protein [Deltaproteobacteria bacterium]